MELSRSHLACDPSDTVLGPFTDGQTIRICTSVTTTHGTRAGEVRQLTLIALPV